MQLRTEWPYLFFTPKIYIVTEGGMQTTTINFVG